MIDIGAAVVVLCEAVVGICRHMYIHKAQPCCCALGVMLAFLAESVLYLARMTLCVVQAAPDQPSFRDVHN